MGLHHVRRATWSNHPRQSACRRPVLDWSNSISRRVMHCSTSLADRTQSSVESPSQYFRDDPGFSAREGEKGRSWKIRAFGSLDMVTSMVICINMHISCNAFVDVGSICGGYYVGLTARSFFGPLARRPVAR